MKFPGQRKRTHFFPSTKTARIFWTMSEKYRASYLTYSSIAQIAKYANSVCYEVLKSPPRLNSAEGLSKGEPEP